MKSFYYGNHMRYIMNIEKMLKSKEIKFILRSK